LLGGFRSRHARPHHELLRTSAADGFIQFPPSNDHAMHTEMRRQHPPQPDNTAGELPIETVRTNENRLSSDDGAVLKIKRLGPPETRIEMDLADVGSTVDELSIRRSAKTIWQSPTSRPQAEQ